MNLTTSINNIISFILEDNTTLKEELISLLQKYFQITITSYNVTFNSNINNDQINSSLNLSNPKNTYIFYTTELPEVVYNFDVSNVFESFSEQLSNLVSLQSFVPQLKNIQLQLYRKFEFPNVNYGQTDSNNISFSIDINNRFIDYNNTITFIKSLLYENQYLFSNVEKKETKIDKYSVDSNSVNKTISSLLSSITSYFDLTLSNFTNIKSLKLQQNTLYEIQIGKFFKLPGFQLNNISFDYSGIIKYNNAYIPEFIKINLSFIPIYPVTINESLNVTSVTINNKTTQIVGF